MIRLVWSGARFAPGRALALGAGMLVAAIAFALLTASVNVGQARIKGVVGRNWRGAYDLLVLPAKSAQAAAHKHLVQVNYLSADTSGISISRYRRITHLPGVGVARSRSSLIAITRTLAAERARPVMRLTISGRQAWTQVVSSLSTRGADRESVALFVLILVVCASCEP